MAGSTCNACGAQYAQIKSQCPNCGAVISQNKEFVYPPAPTISKKTFLFLAGIFGTAILFTWAMSAIQRDIDTPDPVPQRRGETSKIPDDAEAKIAYLFMSDETKTPENRRHFATIVVNRLPGTQEAKEAQALIAKMDADPSSFQIKGSWSYQESEDDLSGKLYKTAILYSENEFKLDFPYAGEQRGTLMLRHHPKHGRDVVVSIERGQILCHSYGDCSVEIAFDDRPARTVQGNEPASRETTAVFLPQPQRLMKDIAGAREMRVRLILYNQPAQVLRFNVAGLDLQKVAL